jgi:hypothetical protein
MHAVLQSAVLAGLDDHRRPEQCGRACVAAHTTMIRWTRVYVCGVHVCARYPEATNLRSTTPAHLGKRAW